MFFFKAPTTHLIEATLGQKCLKWETLCKHHSLCSDLILKMIGLISQILRPINCCLICEGSYLLEAAKWGQVWLGSISCKHNIRWRHLSQMKDASTSLMKHIWVVKNATGFHPVPVTPSATDSHYSKGYFRYIFTRTCVVEEKALAFD